MPVQSEDNAPYSSSSLTHIAMRAVIVGGGVAGTTCAATLFSLAPTPDLEIVLIDPQPALKTSEILSRVTRTAFDVSITEASAQTWCKQRGITFLRASAKELRPPYVELSTGERVRYDAICIATGARPYLPRGLRSDECGKQILTLRDRESVERLRGRIGQCGRVVVVGGGGIGMEVVEGVLGCQVVWVVRGGWVGGGFFDQRGAGKVEKLFGLEGMEMGKNGRQGKRKDVEEQNGESWKRFGSGAGPDWLGRRFGGVLLDREGKVERGEGERAEVLEGKYGKEKGPVRIVLNCEVMKLEKDKSGEWEVNVVLSDGSVVGSDMVLVGAGVVPNVQWVSTSGVEVDCSGKGESCGGILVNAENMMSSLEGVFATGDCTTMREGTYGKHWFQMRLWTQGVTSGKACGESMGSWIRGEGGGVVGLEFEVFAHVTRFFGMKVVLLGNYKGEGMGDGFRMIEGERDGGIVRVVLKEGRVVGAMLVGEVEGGEVFENLILDGIDVSEIGEGLVDPDFDLEDFFD